MSSQSAFGLVELILGMFLVTAALTVVMLPAIRAIRYTAEDRQAVLATQLAQEGAEIVRNVRDTRFAQVAPGAAALKNAFPDVNSANHFRNYCGFDYRLRNVAQLVEPQCVANVAAVKTGLRFMNGFYRTAPDNTAAFHRLIRISAPNDQGDRYDVEVYVTWNDPNGASVRNRNADNCTRANRCVFLRATFTDWDYWSSN